MKILLDANVIFSASLSARGTAQALLIAAHDAQAQCVCSDYAWSQARRNLTAKAPQALPRFALIEPLVARVPEPAALYVEDARHAGVAAQDAPVFGAALQCRADLFVTGDLRHFGNLFGQRIDTVRVLSLRAAIDHLVPPRGRAARKPGTP